MKGWEHRQSRGGGVRCFPHPSSRDCGSDLGAGGLDVWPGAEAGECMHACNGCTFGERVGVNRTLLQPLVLAAAQLPFTQLISLR